MMRTAHGKPLFLSLRVSSPFLLNGCTNTNSTTLANLYALKRGSSSAATARIATSGVRLTLLSLALLLLRSYSLSLRRWT
jgi:hypothetical protein